MIRTNGTLHEDQYTFTNISRSVLPIMKNVSDNSCKETQTKILYSVTFLKIIPFMRAASVV